MTITGKDTTLTDVDSDSTKVNSGTAISMNCTKISYGVGVFLQADPQPGKSIDQTHSNLLPYGDYIGFESPIITIDGVIDVTSSTSNTITLKLLQQMYTSGHIFSLSDKLKLTEDGSEYWRIHTLSGTFNTEVASVIKVQIKGVSVNTNNEIREGQKITYSITLVEVRT